MRFLDLASTLALELSAAPESAATAPPTNDGTAVVHGSGKDSPHSVLEVMARRKAPNPATPPRRTMPMGGYPLAGTETIESESGPQFSAQGPVAFMMPPGSFGDPRLTRDAARKAAAREAAATKPAPAPEPTAPAPTEPEVEQDAPDDKSPLRAGDFLMRGYLDSFAVANWSNLHSRTASVPFTGYDMPSGLHFGLFAIDLIYARPTFVAEVDLRFGPNALAQNILDKGTELENITTAMGTWLPKVAKGKFSLDFGKFMSPIGLEAYNPWENVAYAYAIPTGMLVPNTHLGLRGNVFVNDALAVSFLAINSIWYNLDNNRGKSFGLNTTYMPSDKLRIGASYMTGPENPDQLDVECDVDTAYDADTGECAASLGAEASTTQVTVARGRRPWMHIANAHVTVRPWPKLRFAADGMLVYDRIIDNPVTRSMRPTLDVGAIGLVEWQYRKWGSTGVRASAVYDRDGWMTGYTDPQTGKTRPMLVGEATFNLSFSPNRYLDIMLDNRVDVASRPYYDVAGSRPGQAMFSTMVSMMAHVM